MKGLKKKVIQCKLPSDLLETHHNSFGKSWIIWSLHPIGSQGSTSLTSLTKDNFDTENCQTGFNTLVNEVELGLGII